MPMITDTVVHNSAYDYRYGGVQITVPMIRWCTTVPMITDTVVHNSAYMITDTVVHNSAYDYRYGGVQQCL